MEQHHTSQNTTTTTDADDVDGARRLVASAKAQKRAKRREDRAERVAHRQAERDGATKEAADLDRARARGLQGVADVVDRVIGALRDLTHAVNRAVDSRDVVDQARQANAQLRERLSIVEAAVSELTPETKKTKTTKTT